MSEIITKGNHKIFKFKCHKCDREVVYRYDKSEFKSANKVVSDVKEMLEIEAEIKVGVAECKNCGHRIKIPEFI